MQLNKLAATLAAVGLAVPGAAMATNGMIMEGYGPIAAGMGGASMAYDNAVPRWRTTRPRWPDGGRHRLDVMLGFVGPDVDTRWVPPRRMPSTCGYRLRDKAGRLAYGAAFTARVAWAPSMATATWRR